MSSKLGVSIQVLALGVDCQAGLSLKRQSLPWPQKAPTEPPQGTAETLSQDGGASRKMYVRKRRTMKTEGKNTV